MNYSAEDIVVLTLSEAVRKRPGMYFGPAEDRMNHVALELVANAVDLFLRGQATQVHVTTSPDTITVWDDGPGLPLETDDDLEVFRTLHRAATRDGHAPHIHIAGFGVGLAAIAAIAAPMRVESWVDGVGRAVEIHAGEVVEGPFLLPGEGVGTTIRWTVDRTVCEATHVDGRLRRALLDTVHLCGGLKICLDEETFLAKQGLLDLCYLLHPGQVNFWQEHTTVHRRETVDDTQIEVAGIITGSSELRVQPFCNGLRSTGDHYDAMNDRLADIGGTWAVHAVMLDPKYAKPTRDEVRTPGLYNAVADVIDRALMSSRELQ